MSEAETNPYVFIVGCPRSGTTLLQRLVNAHPRIAITPETHWIPRVLENHSGLRRDGTVTPEVIPVLLDEPRFLRLWRSKHAPGSGVVRFGDRVISGFHSQVAADRFLEDLNGLATLARGDKPVSYSAFVAKIFGLYGQSKRKSLVGDKTPQYVRKMKTLHALWPKARFVHLIRDGRDVCLSWLNWKGAERNLEVLTTWEEDPTSTIALRWELDVRSGQQAGRELARELYHEVRYESLVARPAEECEALCAFLGIPYDDAMLHFHEGRTIDDPNLDAKNAWRPVTAGLRNWRTQMAPQVVERFEAAAGGLLDELGYARVVRPSEALSLEHAAKIRQLLAEDASASKALAHAANRTGTRGAMRTGSPVFEIQKIAKGAANRTATSPGGFENPE